MNLGKISVLTILIITSITINTTEPERIRCTCYTGGTITASGTEPRVGIIAARPEDIGKTAVLYTEQMELIGVYQIEDTGGTAIQSGRCIDVYCNSLSDCYEWISEYGDYVYIQIIEVEIKWST